MTKFSTLLIVLIVIGLIVGLYISYRMIKAQRQLTHLKYVMQGTDQIVETMNNHLDNIYDHSMVFLHHSVGHGILYDGGLQDSLLRLGIVVRGATYGDEIGQQTDICDWFPKFDKNLDKILTFKAHPDKYFENGRRNDIVMFKSCFPNNNIIGDGSGAGDPASRARTIANFEAAFEELQTRLASEPKTLFIYMTTPPLVPEETSKEESERAKKFNSWLMEKYWPSYKEKTGLDNFVIYDLFGFLSDKDGYLKQEYRPEWPNDSHPNHAANTAVAADFMQFLEPIWKSWISGRDGTSNPEL